jgi:hypothetical protein
MRVMASISIVEHSAIYIPLAKEMREANFRFIGFLWSLGRQLVINDLDYVCAPFFNINENRVQNDIPVIEFRDAGIFENTPPLSVRKSMVAFRVFIENEMKSYRPDVVIVASTGFISCYMTMFVARSMGIPVLSLHPSFMPNRYIVNQSIDYWQENLRNLPLTGNLRQFGVDVKLRSGEAFFYKKTQWYRGINLLRLAERLVRQLPMAHRLESSKKLLSILVTKFQKRKWFIEWKTLEVLEEVKTGFLLVVLHQPILEKSSPKWEDLTIFATQCAPTDLPIVIRPHPQDTAPVRVPLEVQRALEGRLVFISRIESGPKLAPLLEYCRAVLTISSATGVEALLKGKPVFTLAPTFYSRLGCAEFVSLHEHDRIRTMLTHNSIQKPKLEEVQKFINLIVNDHTIVDPASSADGCKCLANRVRNAKKQCAS